MGRNEIDQVAETRKAMGREKIRHLTEKIDGNHYHVKAFVKGIADSGKFLKLFSEYANGLGDSRSDESDQLLLDNLVFARKKAAKLTEGLENAEKLLTGAKEMAEEIKRVQVESGLVDSAPPDTEVDDPAGIFDAVAVPVKDSKNPPWPSLDEDKPFDAGEI